MLKEAIQYLVGLKDNKTYEFDGKHFSDHQLVLVEAPKFYRNTVHFGSLDAIVKMVRAELGDYTDGTEPVFILINDHENVAVFTRPDEREKRQYPYEAKCADAGFKTGWRSQQEAIIELKSRFLPTEDSEYLIGLISRINCDQGVQSTDNGVSQTVVTRQGVSLFSNENVKQRLSMQPFRTFREVPQPESEFILRLNDSGDVGLFEADGGIWKMEAKDLIKAYFEEHLHDEIEMGVVVVMV